MSVPDPDPVASGLPSWADYLNYGELSRLAANVYMRLAAQTDDGPAKRNYVVEAERHARHALANQSDANQRTHVLDMVRLAHVCLLHGEPAAAAVVATDALAAAAGMGSFLVVGRATTLYKLLAECDTGHPAVSDFMAAFRRYLAEHTTSDT